MELYKSRVVCYGSVLLFQLTMLPCHRCTPVTGGSLAVLVCIRGADSAARGAAGPVPFLTWGGGSGARTRGWGAKRGPWSQLWWLERREGKGEEDYVWGALGRATPPSHPFPAGAASLHPPCPPSTALPSLVTGCRMGKANAADFLPEACIARAWNQPRGLHFMLGYSFEILF